VAWSQVAVGPTARAVAPMAVSAMVVSAMVVSPMRPEAAAGRQVV
jgi:hypothetical protein